MTENIQMNNYNLATALRYIFPSMVVLFYLFICEVVSPKYSYIKSLLAAFGDLEILGIITVVFAGSLIYFIYRSLIYNKIVMVLQDKSRRKSENYRVYLRKRYKNYKLDSHQAMQLWMQIKENYRESHLKNLYSQIMLEHAAGIHLLYMSAFIAVPFMIWRFSVGNVISGFIFVGIFLLCFFSAFLLDKSYEDIEVRALYRLDEVELDAFTKPILDKIKKM